MINKILIGTGIVAGIAHNCHDIKGAFWIFELCFLAVLWINRAEIIQIISE